MLMRVVPKESPVISLPQDLERVAQLVAKLAEYRERMASDLHAVDHLTMMKIDVLDRLINEGSIETWTVSRELEAKYGLPLLRIHFNTAVSVIVDYCLTGGKNLKSGTGLPRVGAQGVC